MLPGSPPWCRVTGIPTATVAELNEDYIAEMEDVLETYEKPYDPEQLVVCLEEKPVTAACRCPSRLRSRTGTRNQAG